MYTVHKGFKLCKVAICACSMDKWLDSLHLLIRQDGRMWWKKSWENTKVDNKTDHEIPVKSLINFYGAEIFKVDLQHYKIR